MSARAISGTRRAMKELVDGTLRVSIDIDPQSRRDFLRLFSEIDMRVALAPLKPQLVVASDDGLKGGELARLAGILCSDNDFRMWLQSFAPADLVKAAMDAKEPDERAAIVMRGICGVDSRAELDHNAAAAERFHELVRKPWLAFRGAA